MHFLFEECIRRILGVGLGMGLNWVWGRDYIGGCWQDLVYYRVCKYSMLEVSILTSCASLASAIAILMKSSIWEKSFWENSSPRNAFSNLHSHKKESNSKLTSYGYKQFYTFYLHESVWASILQHLHTVCE